MCAVLLRQFQFDGYRYFVTFIDDYTHLVAVYLMKHLIALSHFMPWQLTSRADQCVDFVVTMAANTYQGNLNNSASIKESFSNVHYRLPRN